MSCVHCHSLGLRVVTVGWCRVNKKGTVKVADFGLSRQLLLRDYYRSGGSGMTPVPVRWLAPESLEVNVFTTMSDVVRLIDCIYDIFNLHTHTHTVLARATAAGHAAHITYTQIPPNSLNWRPVRIIMNE